MGTYEGGSMREEAKARLKKHQAALAEARQQVLLQEGAIQALTFLLERDTTQKLRQLPEKI
jgi:hypothetical protein